MSAATLPDWINAIAALFGAAAVWIGLLGAKSTIDENRRSVRELRRSEVAEELIALAFNADDALKDMRNPFSSVPLEKAADKQYPYEQRYKTVVKYNELFKSMREAQIRLRAVIGNQTVDDAVDTLFKARARVATAIEFLADMERDDYGSIDQEDREEAKKLRKDLYGSFGSRDQFGQEILAAIKKIEDVLSPIARLEARK